VSGKFGGQKRGVGERKTISTHEVEIRAITPEKGGGMIVQKGDPPVFQKPLSSEEGGKCRGAKERSLGEKDVKQQGGGGRDRFVFAGNRQIRKTGFSGGLRSE